MADEREPDPTTQAEWEHQLDHMTPEQLAAASQLAETDAARRAAEALRQQARDRERRRKG